MKSLRFLVCAPVFALVASAALAFEVQAAMSVPLNGEWRLDYFPQPDDGALRELPIKVPMETVQATVPGNCELDLVNAGVLPPPELGMNVLKLRPYEGYQWLYTKVFPKPCMKPGQRAMLTFEGIDTLADIFLNGTKIGETSNMLIPHSFNVTGKLKDGENTVQVLIRSVMCEAQYMTIGELGYSMGDSLADAEPFRKAGHMGGWDIFPRAFVSGLWRDVSIEVQDPVRIDQTAWIVCSLDVPRKRADLMVTCRVQMPFRNIGKANIKYTVSRNEKVSAEFVNRLETYQNIARFQVPDASPWWPRGMGDATLYDATIEITGDDGEVWASHTEKIGFRTVKLERDDVYGPDRPGQFLFRINGEPCYVRGSNWVPLDAFHCRDGKFMKPTLEMFADLNCNMVRVWGGGVYEPDEFFDFCDANGLMVWQDFMTGCSAFPQSDEYAKATEIEVRTIVLKYRNRASLVLWSGNNENDEAFKWKLGPLARDPNKDRSSRFTIPNVLYEFDVTRPYLPSSPYESPDVIAGKAQPSEKHLWGMREYYKVPYYTNSPCWFASEMGYHGMPSRALLEKVMSKDAVYPWKGTPAKFEKNHLKLEWNDEWLLRASNPLMRRNNSLVRRNNLMTNQIRIMFGGVDTDLDTFIAQSQTIQAEAMKTFCELFRSRKFTRFNGLVWWNVRDGWPQLSDAVVDYYGGKKPAYYALRSVQQDQLVMLRDDHSAWAVNDTLRPVKGHATYRDKVSGKVLLDCDYEVPANSKTHLGMVPFSGQGLVEIEYRVDGKEYRNHFLYGEPPFKWEEVKEWMKDTVLWRP
jgi:beta-mannosidase